MQLYVAVTGRNSSITYRSTVNRMRYIKQRRMRGDGGGVRDGKKGAVMKSCYLELMRSFLREQFVGAERY